MKINPRQVAERLYLYHHGSSGRAFMEGIRLALNLEDNQDSWNKFNTEVIRWLNEMEDPNYEFEFEEQ